MLIAQSRKYYTRIFACQQKMQRLIEKQAAIQIHMWPKYFELKEMFRK